MIILKNYFNIYSPNIFAIYIKERMKPNALSKERLTANALKKSIYTYLISRDPQGIIGSEVMYGSSRRVADLVFISQGLSYAIEIKSEYDSTYRLEGQLEEYQTLFDYIIVFSAPNHIRNISSVIPNFMGLYSISNTGIEIIQREKRNRQVLKSEMLISIPSSTVKSDFSIKGRLSSDEIRAQVLRKSKKEIHTYFINYFKGRLESKANIILNNTTLEHEDNSEDYLII